MIFSLRHEGGLVLTTEDPEEARRFAAKHAAEHLPRPQRLRLS